MEPQNLWKIQKSFSVQAEHFESQNMNFSKQEYLDYTVKIIKLAPADHVLEVAAGTCACGRSIAPFVQSVVCLDATPAMLAVGKKEAERSGITNMQFIDGFAEDLPFPDQSFDIVLTRLAFHHFTQMEGPFAQMNRVLKKGGKLVIIDMEAAAEELREIEDRIETMRDPSHIKNRSKQELVGLFEKQQFLLQKQQSTVIPVALDAWLNLTDTPKDTRAEIMALMKDDMDGENPTGFAPYLKDGEIYFDQRWLLMIGIKDR